MKKLIIICLAGLLWSGIAWADVVFYNSNQATLEWNVVATDVDGDPITGVTYRLYLSNADTDPNKSNPVIAVDNIIEISATVTLGTKGRFFVGVSALLDDLESAINWGDEQADQETVDLFGLRFAVPPHAPKNIKK